MTWPPRPSSQAVSARQGTCSAASRWVPTSRDGMIHGFLNHSQGFHLANVPVVDRATTLWSPSSAERSFIPAWGNTWALPIMIPGVARRLCSVVAVAMAVVMAKVSQSGGWVLLIDSIEQPHEPASPRAFLYRLAPDQRPELDEGYKCTTACVTDVEMPESALCEIDWITKILCLERR